MVTAILICTLVALVLGSAWVDILEDPTYRADADYCYNCPCGWCNCVPGDENCERRKNDE